MLLVPLCLGLALAADPLVRVAFGEQWLAAIPVVRVLALFVLVRSIGYNVGDVYKATGQPGVLVKLGLFHLALLAPALWLGAQWGGLLGIASGHLVAALISTAVYVTVAMRRLKITPSLFLRQLRPSFLGGAVMSLIVLPLLYLTEPWTPLLRLALIGAVGAAAYLVTLWTVERPALLQAAQTLGLSRLRFPASATAAASAGGAEEG
jgi:O-antigen/teichoic acid export membrane protein